MSLKSFLLFFVAWFIACAWVLEPAFVAPYFEGATTIKLAFSDPVSELQGLQVSESIAHSMGSMDHFRALCLFYFGIPVAVYLASQFKLR